MALIVEDGTGKADAESYVSVADLRAWAASRGQDVTAKTDPQVEAALREATAYVDTCGRYKATRLRAEQALEFPRQGLTDWSGFEVVGVPKRVRDACCDLVLQALASGGLYATATKEDFVASKSVGPISKSYMAGAGELAKAGGKVFTAAMASLKPYLRKTGDIEGGPKFTMPAGPDGGEAAPSFAVGMHDNPGGY